MTAINPAGDSRQGFLVRGGFCDQFPQPSQSTDENVLTLNVHQRRIAHQAVVGALGLPHAPAERVLGI